MGKYKYLTLDDLRRYFVEQGESFKFNSGKTNDGIIVVSTPADLKFEQETSEDLMPVVLRACHTGRNLNGSSIEDSVMEAALPSFSNKPILGYIHEVDGKPEFRSHDMHMEDGDIVYDEIPVGIIPESGNAHLEYDADADHNVVVVNGYIYEAYSKAAEIIRREEELSVSVELGIRELSYDAKDKVLVIEDFFFYGVTILGKYDDGSDVNPGMAGSNITLADFTAKEEVNHSINEKLVEALENLNSTLSRLHIENNQEGGNEVTKFEELLEQYGVTADDIEFEYEGLSDEELEEKFAESFGEQTDGDEGQEDNAATTEDSDGEGSDDTDSEEEPDSDPDESGDAEFTKTFSISHEDIRTALYALLAPYEEEDGDWYWITAVYDDHFAYEGAWTNAIYGQNYKTDGDNVSFEGERYTLHRELLTDSEYVALQDMRANYEALKQFKENAEAEQCRQSKMDILNDEKFSVLDENEALQSLIENIDNYSLEDFEKEAKVILADYVVAQGSFSYKGKNEKPHKIGFEINTDKVDEPYGTLFSKK